MLETVRRFILKNRFLVASVALHALLLLALSLDDRNDRLAQDDMIEIEFVQIPDTIAKDIRDAQIAETTLIEKAKEADPKAYLGQQTQVVQQQTRAKTTAPFRDGKVGSSGDRGKHSKMALGDLGVSMNLKPLGHLGPGEVASTSDHLNDVRPGAQTLLNTREYAFFGFYQRVRGQLEQYWEPGLRNRLKKMFERGRRLASDKEHLTRVLVVMNSEGLITRIQVESSSGLLDLDQAAVDAFNKAGPFPNPPRGMVEADGTVKVEWEFVLKT